MYMVIDLRFTTPVDPMVDFVSVGTLEFEFGSQVIPFDFERSIGEVDAYDPRVIHFRLRNLDTNAFPDAAVLLKKYIWNSLTAVHAVDVDTWDSDSLQLASVPRVSVEGTDWETPFDVPLRVLAQFEENLLKVGGVA